MNSSPAIVVLAAGKGSRFSAAEHKLMQALGGTTVLGSTLRHAIASHLPVVVVTTPLLADLAKKSIAARDVVVLPEVGTPGASLGMGHSIAAGVAARPQASGWVIVPGDMPMVRAATMALIARQLQQQPVVYAQHRGRRGHPVGFAAELYSELVMLSGDEGARRLLARYPAHAVDVDDPGVLVDVDTAEDLDSVRRSQPEVAAPLTRW